MKNLLWILLLLFLIGDAFFVLPWHLSKDKVVINSFVSYKKDSLLLLSAVPDTSINLELNMPASYQALYQRYNKTRQKPGANSIIVNVSFFDDLDFTGLCFPFYKVSAFRAVIPFNSIIKAVNAPGLDSTALIGNIIMNGKVVVAGISSPIHARQLVDERLTEILKNQMDSIKIVINRRPDTSQLALPLPEPVLPMRGRHKGRNS